MFLDTGEGHDRVRSALGSLRGGVTDTECLEVFVEDFRPGVQETHKDIRNMDYGVSAVSDSVYPWNRLYQHISELRVSYSWTTEGHQSHIISLTREFECCQLSNCPSERVPGH